MIALFVNLHKNDENGKMRFKKYYYQITKILKKTLYYGANYQQIIRDKQDIDDFLYDDCDLIKNEREEEKFRSVTHIFIEGPVNISPWSHGASKVLLLIRNSLKENKKIFLNGFGHIAGYYYLSTKFDKKYIIRNLKNLEDQPQQIFKNINKVGSNTQNYFYEEQTGDLYSFGRKICNSGVKVDKNSSSKYYGSKSVQALKNGVILPTKSHYMAFGSRNGHELLKNISFPFALYEKNKIFCTPPFISKAKVTVLVETQDKIPLVYLYNETLSTHLLCEQTLKIFTNWIHSDTNVYRNQELPCHNTIDALGFDNYANRMKTHITFSVNSIQKDKISTIPIESSSKFSRQMKSQNLLSKFQTINVSRPKTAMTNKTIISAKSKFLDFEKPSIRCSGPYETQMDKIFQQQKLGKSKLFGKSRMIFKSDMDKNEIQNYVQRTPSRPASSHKFRDINKCKWMDRRTFFVT